MSRFSILRRQAGFSITDLATQLGATKETVSAWDDGSGRPPNHVLRALDFTTEAIPPNHELQTTSAIGVQSTPVQRTLPGICDWDVPPAKDNGRSGAFTDNMKLPIHRWFRYSAGFSAEWVGKLIAERRNAGTSNFVFDPFAGSGTTLLAAQQANVASAGAERHPFIHRVARAKLSWDTDVTELRLASQQLIDMAKGMEHATACSPRIAPEMLLA